MTEQQGKIIAIGSDHAAFREKEALRRCLIFKGHIVIDAGCDSDASCDYPEFAIRVAEMVSGKKAERGILLCGTGIGMSIAANKIPGVRAAVVFSETSAKAASEHNKANIICMGAREFTLEILAKFTHIWLDTKFEESEGSRHARRIQMINALDRRSYL